jgi:glycosyltransferase involved in cell wall biosynthesis
MMPPLISVLITVYNRERYVAEAVESVLAQTMRDFEVIIVDDASTDGSAKIVEKYAGLDSRVRFFRNDRNLGDFPNRRRAAEHARGQYLKYVDSDDLIYPHSLAIMAEAMEGNPDAALALGHSEPDEDCPYPWKLTPAEAWRKQFLGRGCLDSGPTAAIIRRDAFFEIGGFGDWGVLNDADLWYRMSARWPVVLLAPGLVWWRRHERQEFTKNNAAMVYLERGFALTVERLSSPECPLTAAERKAAAKRARQRHARRLLALGLRQRRPREAWRLFRGSGLSVAELFGGLRKYAA